MSIEVGCVDHHGLLFAVFDGQTESRPVVVELRGSSRPTDGGRLRIAFDSAAALVFDAESGLRMR